MFKRLILFVVLGLLLIYTPCFAAGSCVQILNGYGQNAQVLTFSCTGDASAGTFPSIPTNTAITALIKGWYIVEVRTFPGAGVPPTNAYDILLNTALTPAIDLMGGALADRSSTLGQRAFPSTITPLIDGALSLVITGTTVNSATMTIQVFLYRDTQTR